MQATCSVSTPIVLAEIFPPDAIVIGLVQRTKQGVIEELVHHLVELGNLVEGEEKAVVESVLAREKMGFDRSGERDRVSALPLKPHGEVHRRAWS